MIAFPPCYEKNIEEGLVTKNEEIIAAFRSQLPRYEKKIIARCAPE